MCYNVYIMKKYCFLIAFVLSAAVLSGCSVNKPATVVYTDSPPPLTAMTEITTIPADTYSQYMETYTPPTTTGTDVYYYHLPPSENIGADTGMYSILKPNPPQQDMLYKDTAATRNSTVSTEGSSEPAETTAVREEGTGETTETQIPETAAPSAGTSYYPERPSADTGFSGMVSADTAHSAQSVTTAPPETSETSSEQ